MVRDYLHPRHPYETFQLTLAELPAENYSGPARDIALNPKPSTLNPQPKTGFRVQALGLRDC